MVGRAFSGSINHKNDGLQLSPRTLAMAALCTLAAGPLCPSVTGMKFSRCYFPSVQRRLTVPLPRPLLRRPRGRSSINLPYPHRRYLSGKYFVVLGARMLFASTVSAAVRRRARRCRVCRSCASCVWLWIRFSVRRPIRPLVSKRIDPASGLLSITCLLYHDPRGLSRAFSGSLIKSLAPSQGAS